MSGSYTPYLVLAGIVLFTLWRTGFLSPLTSIALHRPLAQPATHGPPTAVPPTPMPDLGGYPAYVLAEALAKAVTREAAQAAQHAQVQDLVAKVTTAVAAPPPAGGPANP